MNKIKSNESLHRAIKVPELPRFVPKHPVTKTYHSYSFFVDGQRQEAQVAMSRRLERSIDEMEARRVTMHV